MVTFGDSTQISTNEPYRQTAFSDLRIDQHKRGGVMARQRLGISRGVATVPLITLLVALLGGAEGRCEYRHALVIGQSAYKTGPLPGPLAGPLAAPARDAAAVAEALSKHGFTVTRVENLATTKELDDTLRAFARSVTTGGTALVYFSGNASWATVPQGMNPPRQELALTTLDGNKHLLSAVLRPLVVPSYGPYGHGWQGPQSGSRINVLLVDAILPEPPQPPPSPSANSPASPAKPDETTAAGKAKIESAPLPESLVILRPDVPAPQAASAKPAAAATPAASTPNASTPAAATPAAATSAAATPSAAT
ncbi:MAG: caspase family protein, partial [Planctomycetota bacterium]